jgi:hypothetical protein
MVEMEAAGTPWSPQDVRIERDKVERIEQLGKVVCIRSQGGM